jgi:hypothetical protein
VSTLPRIALLLSLAALIAGPVAHAGIMPSTELSHAGQVRLGDRVADGTQGWTRLDDAAMEADLHCAYYRNPDRLPRDVVAMVAEGVVVRFELDTPGRPGPFGVTVGMTETQARDRMPADTETSTHHYGEEPHDHYLTWRDPADGSALRAEVEGGRVSRLYWGRWPAVQLIEGCL